jgi:hypothetical protein
MAVQEVQEEVNIQIVVCRHGRQQIRYQRSRVSMRLWDMLGIDGKYQFRKQNDTERYPMADRLSPTLRTNCPRRLAAKGRLRFAAALYVFLILRTR